MHSEIANCSLQNPVLLGTRMNIVKITNFLADLPRHLTDPIWNSVVCVIVIMFCIGLSGTQQISAENVALEKNVQVTPEGNCTSYCGDRQGDCTTLICNDTCPSGITTPPQLLFRLSETKDCAKQSVPMTSDRASDQRTVVHAFSNDSSICTFSQNISHVKSFTLVFWVKVSSDLKCDLNAQPGYCKVLWIKDKDGDILSVEVSLMGVKIKSKSGSIDSKSKLTSWQNVTVLVSEDNLVGILNGELKNATVLSPGLTLKDDIKLKWGTQSGSEISSGMFALADIKLYTRAVDGREINKMNGIDAEPHVAPECRCGVPALIEVGPLGCKNVNGGGDVSRVNSMAHFIEYVNDGDEKTAWVSDQRDSSNISIELGARNQIFNITIQFGTSVPRKVVIERVLGPTTLSESRDISSTESEVLFSWPADSENRSTYEKTVATTVRVILQGHADDRDYHSIAEIFISGRRACYGSQSTPSGEECVCQTSTNTTSDHCQNCKRGHYHNDSLVCSSCNCDRIGSDGECDQVTGVCVCVQDKHMTGPKCSQCEPFYYNLSSAGCEECDCNREGARRCDAVNGQCECLANVEGVRCDRCKAGHYWTEDGTGCAPCGCHESGSISTSCTVADGQCSCKSNYQGRDCSSCMPGYWGFPDCNKCPVCKPLGSLNDTCESISGQCFCIGGVKENKNCDAVISDIVPAYGPLAGGTRVTIRGQLLGEGSNFTAYMNEIRQISLSRNHTSLVFETQNTSMTGSVDIRVELGQGVERKLNATKFEYRVNPSVVSITPSAAIASGGIMLTVTGSNLNSVYKPVLRAYNDNALQATQECLVEDRNLTTMYCPSPRLKKSGVAGENYFQLGIAFDGFEDYLRLPESVANLTLHDDPSVTEWSETRHFTYPFNQVIQITGSNFTVAAKVTDYTVAVGSGDCPISQLTESQIVCVPPSSKPDDPQINITDTVNVMVKVGFLEVTVGRLHYVPFYKSKEFIGIMAGIGGLFILIVVAIVVRKCRQGRIHRRPSVPGYKPDRPGSVGSYHGPIGTIGPRPELPPIPHPKSLFDRLDHPTQEEVAEAKVDKQFFKPGKICTKKGELARITDGQFTSQSPVSPGKKLTIKAFVNAVPENAAVPPWAKEAIKQAMYFRGHIHPNVLELLGMGFDMTRAYFLYPHMSNRSLKEYIVNPQIDIQHNELLEYALQIAEGMEFLSNHGLFHKDLAARNCMVDDDLIIKISDIAFASDLYRSEYVYDRSRDIYRPLRWMALEYMTQGYHDTKSDVWSYGIVVWELFNRGLLPYHDIADENIQTNVEGRNRPEKPPMMSDKMDALMLSCWDENSQKRPSFTDIVQLIYVEVGPDPTYSNGDYINVAAEFGGARGKSRASSFYKSRPGSNIYGNVPVVHNPGRSVRRY